jgi:molybdate/tungstate transport system substrate-binding protein
MSFDVRNGARMAGACALLLIAGARAAVGQSPGGPLVVFNAGSLAKPFRELLIAFRQAHPAVEPAQENSGSLEAARKLTDLGKIPDVLAVADYSVMPALLIPRHASWYVLFARSEMVLAYADGATGAEAIDSTNWFRVLLRPDVRTGHSDPALDPAGYRTLMVYQLAEAHYRQPGLAGKLAAAVPRRYVRPKSADLVALLQTGELDYAWEYEAVARQRGLRYLRLPREINLGDPALNDVYARAAVRVPGTGGKDSIEIRGEPIAYAVTIPRAAPHASIGGAFVRFLLSAEGRAIVEANGFAALVPPIAGGPAQPPPGLF